MFRVYLLQPIQEFPQLFASNFLHVQDDDDDDDDDEKMEKKQ